MQKPKLFDETRTARFERIMTGPHKAVIKQVEERKSAAGKDMIAVYIDFDKDDVQPGYFSEAYKADTREKKKWPYQAVQYILVTDNEGNTNRSFKQFVEAYEDSNDRQVVWGDNFGKQFVGAKIGVTYGDVEEEYEGQLHTRQRIRWFFKLEDIENESVPDLKPFKGNLAPAPASNTGTDWMDLSAVDDEDLPFR